MKMLIIINDAPYRSENAFNASRIGNQINKDYPDALVKIFLMTDSVSCADPSLTTAKGYYNFERMIKLSVNHGTTIKLWGSCMEARGLNNFKHIDNAEVSNMKELAQMIMMNDKVITF